MILPIVAYGDPVLRKVAQDITKDYPKLEELIDNMKETMKNAQGVGLAAPQVNQSIRLFIVDATPYAEDYPEVSEFKKIFRIIEMKFWNEHGQIKQSLEEKGLL